MSRSRTDAVRKRTSAVLVRYQPLSAPLETAVSDLRRSPRRSRDATKSTIDVLERWSPSGFASDPTGTRFAVLISSSRKLWRTACAVSSRPRSLLAFCKQQPEGSKPLAAYRSPQFQRTQSRVNDGDLIPTEIHERNDLRHPPSGVPHGPCYWYRWSRSRTCGAARARATRSGEVQHRSARAGATQVDADLPQLVQACRAKRSASRPIGLRVNKDRDVLLCCEF